MRATASEHRRRSTSILLAPAWLYLLVLLGLALFVVHPPLLGWIGLAVVAAVAAALSALAISLLQRTRVNVERLHPHPSDTYRLLVVLDADIEADELRGAVDARTIARSAEVRVVAPAVGPMLHLLTSDAEGDRTAAQARLDAALRALRLLGVRAVGSVGPPDPIEATADALARFSADEIVFVGPLPELRRWADSDFERRARDLFGVRCSTVYGTARPARPERRDAVTLASHPKETS